jgi:protein disulfide-isomerase A1
MYASPELSKLVTVAKVDAIANDVPDEIKGFPTIKLFPAGKKDSPIEYSGSRTIEDLAQFIKENGSHKVEAVVPEQPEVREETGEEMPEQAPAASVVSEKAEEATNSVKSAAAQATEAVKGVDDTQDVHDEL